MLVRTVRGLGFQTLDGTTSELAAHLLVTLA